MTHQRLPAPRRLQIVLLSTWVFALTAVNSWGQSPPITDLAFSPEGTSIVACSQDGLQVFSWPALEKQRSITVSFRNLHCLAFSNDGQRLALGGGNPSENGGVEIFSWPQCKSLMSFLDHEDSVMEIAWSGDQKIVTAGRDRRLIKYDLETEERVQTYEGHSRGINAVCLLPQGAMVTAGHDASVRVWDDDSGTLLKTLSQHTQPVNAIAVCPAESALPMVATAATDRTVRFWQPTIGRLMRYVRLESEPLDIAWLNDSFLVASCVDGRLRCVDFENVQVVEIRPAIEGWAYAITVHPEDGSLAIAGSRGQIRRITLTLPTTESND